MKRVITTTAAIALFSLTAGASFADGHAEAAKVSMAAPVAGGALSVMSPQVGLGFILLIAAISAAGGSK